MTHLNKKGNSKIVESCALPLTASRCVDLIITGMAVIKVTEKGLELIEVMEPHTIAEVVTNTDAPLCVPESIEFVE